MRYEYIFSAITIIIASWVAIVAYQQYCLGKERFKLDLFEKRFAVYKGVQIFLTHVMTDAKVDLEKFFQFRATTQEAIFLFESDIPDFIKEIDNKALRLYTAHEEFRDLPIGEDRSRFAKENSELIRWLVDQLSHLKEIFSPYLKFRVWS